MKKIFFILVAFLLLLTTGCGSKNLEGSVNDIIDSVYKGVDSEFANLGKT